MAANPDSEQFILGEFQQSQIIGCIHSREEN